MADKLTGYLVAVLIVLNFALLVAVNVFDEQLTESREHAADLERCYVQTAAECRKLMAENDELRKVVESYGSN